MAGQSVSGKYRWLDDSTIEEEGTFQGKSSKEKNKVKVTNDTLVETTEQGLTVTFSRVR